jgi:DNA-binding NarL/FixJ family response regulator
MPKRVLDVGQCGPDHSSISRLLRTHFDVEIVPAALPADALDQLRDGKFDLVLINRKLDADYSDGTVILRAIKADESLSGVPVMLVSNYADAQQAAVTHGAEYGFGKAELDAPETLERLARFLR